MAEGAERRFGIIASLASLSGAVSSAMAARSLQGEEKGDAPRLDREWAPQGVHADNSGSPAPVYDRSAEEAAPRFGGLEEVGAAYVQAGESVPVVSVEDALVAEADKAIRAREIPARRGILRRGGQTRARASRLCLDARSLPGGCGRLPWGLSRLRGRACRRAVGRRAHPTRPPVQDYRQFERGRAGLSARRPPRRTRRGTRAGTSRFGVCGAIPPVRRGRSKRSYRRTLL